MATGLAKQRFIQLLHSLADQCSKLSATDGLSIIDSEVQDRVDGWCLQMPRAEVDEAATLCLQFGLPGAAMRLRTMINEVLWQWFDLLLHDRAKEAPPHEIAFLEEKFGRFPLPVGDHNTDGEARRDRYLALFAKIAFLGRVASGLLETIGRGGADLEDLSTPKPTRVAVGLELSPADVAPGDGPGSLDNMRPAFRQAWLAYELARNQTGKELTVPAAHGWLRNNGAEGYLVPSRATFARYVGHARAHLGLPKNRPRAGRNGRSIVSRREI